MAGTLPGGSSSLYQRPSYLGLPHLNLLWDLLLYGIPRCLRFLHFQNPDHHALIVDVAEDNVLER